MPFISARNWLQMCPPKKTTIKFGELSLSNVRPVKPVIGDSALNKGGRLVLKGFLGSEKVKVYEAYSPEHATFINAISRQSFNFFALPEVLDIENSFIATRWIKRKNLGAEKIPSPETLITLILGIHSIPVAKTPAVSFDYWRDLIYPRFARASALLGMEKVATEINEMVSAVWTSKSIVMHPDITPSNIVYDEKNRWCIIDNELLTVGGLPFLDICNMASALNKKRKQLLVECYFDRGGPKLTKIDVEALEAAWLARCAGAAFIRGEIERAQALFQSYSRGHSILPFEIKKNYLNSHSGT